MVEVKHYICEVCGTEYADKTVAVKCESGHKKGLTIVGARYLSISQDASGLPQSITVEYQDGKTKKKAVYKR